MTMKGYINYVAYVAISRGYLTDKYRTNFECLPISFYLETE